jgi:uncharacterized membrane protein
MKLLFTQYPRLLISLSFSIKLLFMKCPRLLLSLEVFRSNFYLRSVQGCCFTLKFSDQAFIHEVSKVVAFPWSFPIKLLFMKCPRLLLSLEVFPSNFYLWSVKGCCFPFKFSDQTFIYEVSKVVAFPWSFPIKLLFMKCPRLLLSLEVFPSNLYLWSVQGCCFPWSFPIKLLFTKCPRLLLSLKVFQSNFIHVLNFPNRPHPQGARTTRLLQIIGAYFLRCVVSSYVGKGLAGANSLCRESCQVSTGLIFGIEYQE